MAETKTRKRINPYPIIISIILVGVAALVLVKILANHNKSETQHTTEPSNITSNVSNTTSPNTTNSSSEKESTKKNTPQYDGEDPNISNALSGSITASRISDQNYILRVNIDQYLTSGTCQLTFTDGENSHTETANIIPSVSSSTCEGFDIPLKALATGHTYNIYIDLSSSDGRTGRITGEAKL